MLLLIPILVQRVRGCNTRTDFHIIYIMLKLCFLLFSFLDFKFQ
ncbi:hypothetical protein Ahy_B04g073708 isoform B [Arachis hypogaea]|uniref:Uncharacterized protein n=1 Tax=Arachis hypogaea TaxID=3818 RepID=A0A444ZR37_ARAHY|nr:hypothetical protein Ahy_B04g073708 isoform B [Arachis hypogaea]